jgi:hypothetical protein
VSATVALSRRQRYLHSVWELVQREFAQIVALEVVMAADKALRQDFQMLARC